MEKRGSSSKLTTIGGGVTRSTVLMSGAMPTFSASVGIWWVDDDDDAV